MRQGHWKHVRGESDRGIGSTFAADLVTHWSARGQEVAEHASQVDTRGHHLPRLPSLTRREILPVPQTNPKVEVRVRTKKLSEIERKKKE